VNHFTANPGSRQSYYCAAGWAAGAAGRCACWSRQARLSARSSIPSWLVSIWSNRAAARCDARSCARSIYCSRVMVPAAGGAGLAGVGLSIAAVWGPVWAKSVPGSNNTPMRATKAVLRICQPLLIAIAHHITYNTGICKRNGGDLVGVCALLMSPRQKSRAWRGAFSGNRRLKRVQFLQRNRRQRERGTTCNTAEFRPIVTSICRGCRPTCSCPRRGAS
jgi:hypothetical protein